MLDNAAAAAQVRLLLPGAGSCLVLITSRRRLKALDDAHTLSLELLPESEAAALMRAAAGPGRIPADDPLLGEVTGLCGYLPLALRIAAALLRHRPAWNLKHLCQLLGERHQHVLALSDGDRDLGAMFGLSYQSLTPGMQCSFRNLGLVPGPDLDAYAAAALTGTGLETAASQLEGLVDQHLLIAYAPGRYRLHDLLRSHARTLARRRPRSRRRPGTRMLAYYAHTAQSASMAISRYPRPEPDGPAPACAPSLASPEAARAWLRAERDNLEAAYALAQTLGLPGHALALAGGLAEILRTDGPFTHALEIQRAAAETAERLACPAQLADALTELGILQQLTGDLAAARGTLTRAAELHHAARQRQGEANTLAELGIVQLLTGDLAGAAGPHSRALEIYQLVGHRQGEADTLTDLGRVQRLTGDLAGAADTFLLALEIHHSTGQRNGEACALTELGRVRRATGDLDSAADALSGPWRYTALAATAAARPAL